MTATRFRPSRAGIINLWDYRDEEFVFVDGWLVLRGPNGSGKTKALEVLFPFVLDGRIEPRRLNPFASEERTMKSNVLYRGQDLNYAYVWMEFHRPATEGGEDEFVTIGIGLRAHRHQDRVQRWHFVAEGRVGADFSLIDPDDRPLNRRELAAELGEEHVYDGLEQYRRAVDARLFGLGQQRYEQFLDLVLTLRKPQLAKDLNPVELSRTLQRGLRPLDESLIAQAAGSFDHMEAVAKTLEGLVTTERATMSFLSVYTTYLRTHARAAADAVGARRAEAVRARQALADAERARVRAQAEYRAAQEQLRAAEGEPGRLRARLESLKSSAAYRSHQALEDLRRHVADLAAAAARAQATAAQEESTVGRREAEQAAAARRAEEAEQAQRRVLARLAEEAEAAGIAWRAEDAEPDGFAERIGARAQARRDDVQAVRHQAERLAQAEREHARAAREVERAREAVAAAEEALLVAQTRLDQTRDALREAVRRWGQSHVNVLAELDAEPAVAALEEAIDDLGTDDGRGLAEVFGEQTAAGLRRIDQEAADRAAQRSIVDDRRAAVARDRELIATARDDAPPRAPGRPADRTDRPGAPLWRLVDFAPTVTPVKAAAIEAALEAAGLLDAWVHPDPALTAAAVAARERDGYLVALAPAHRPSGRTLADLLVVEEPARPGVPAPSAGDGSGDGVVAGAVPAAVVAAVLASIAVEDSLPAGIAGEDGEASVAVDNGRPVVSVAGQYALGVVLGAHAKPAAEYIGATARQRRRAARIAECDRVLVELDAQIAEIDTRLSYLDDVRIRCDAARATLPDARPVRAAAREVDRAATAQRLRREAEQTAAAALDQALAEQSAAALALRQVSAQRSLPAGRVEATAEAVGRFETAATRLEQARTTLATAREQAADAKARLDEAHDRWVAAVEAAQEAAQRHAEKNEAYQIHAAAVGDTDVARVVAEVAATEEAIDQAEATLRRRRDRHTAAYGDLQRAESTVENGQIAVRAAVREAFAEAVRLRPFAHADLLGLLRCPTDLRWPAPPSADATDQTELPGEVEALLEAILTVTKDLTPSENSLKQSATRATAAFHGLQAQLPQAGLDHRAELDTDDGILVVRIADEQGLTPVASFAERIVRERADQEQLLSEAERRVFEDALLTQLARQIHHRTIEARDLVGDMDAQMRSRRMSSGLTVGVGWHLSDDLDPEQRDVCKLLDRDPARLGPAQLATLRSHFASRIKTARTMAPEQPYRDLLAQVLDYRAWRVFAFTLHRPGASPEPLTKARHSQLSGGEQSVSLHLPLFAAAHALFQSANPHAPRLLALDEAFAGVDENGRGELMWLATQFDLDLFMTGYDLWAAHPAVAGCAHYDLSHSAVEHTVATVLITWNGSLATADFDGSLARALGSPATRRAGRAAAVTATPSLLEPSIDLNGD